MLADSAYATGDALAALETAGHLPVVKPWPLRPAITGGFTLDDFTHDPTTNTVTCPNEITRPVTRTGKVTFKSACRGCPLRERCTTATAGRSLTLGPHHARQRAHRQRASSPEHIEAYRRHRPMVERSLAWLTRGHRRVPQHLGYDKHDAAGRDGGNSRNGTRTKTVLTEIGPVEIEVPRDRDASFEPVIVKKRQRRLDGIDEIVLSLTARGLTTGEVAAHFDEVYGAKVSQRHDLEDHRQGARGDDRVAEPALDAVYPVLFVDAIYLKVRDGQVTNRPFYVVVGVTVDGRRDVLGIWAGEGGEGAKYWLQVLTEIKNRGVGDVCIVVCDGLAGLPAAINTVWPQTLVQACVLHLIRNTFRYASRRYWEQIGQGPATGLHRADRGRRGRAVRRVRRHLGRALPRDRHVVAQRPGRSSCRSWTTTWRSARSSARPTRSSRSTPATGGRRKPAGTSPPSRPP